MKKITIYIDNRTGDVIVEHEVAMDKMEVFSALGAATQIIYQKVMEEEARRRQVTSTQLENIVRLMAKQDKPEMN